jgi:hypothetical protein
VPCLVAVGGVKVTSGLDLTKCANPTTDAAATADPYASVPAPTKPSTSCLTVSNASILTLSPGYYCNGISISGSQSATFQAGLYYVDGNFTISGSATDHGTGVTFFITAGHTADISGSTSTTLSAPTSGTDSGIVFFGDRTATNGNNDFSGGSNTSITGAIYFPTENVTFSGGSSSNSNCTQVIADTVAISGSANLSGSCSGAGMATISTPANLQVVE